MSVIGARLWRIALPLETVYVSSMYLTLQTQRTVIELRTEGGIVGWGETLGNEACFALACAQAKARLGRDPADRRSPPFARSAFDNRDGRNGWAAHAGIDLALWDIAGKRLGLGLCEMIGGAVRREIDLACPLPAAMFDAVVPRTALAAHMADLGNVKRVVDYALGQRARHGFGAFKYKSAGLSAEWDFQAMSELRAALGSEVALRFDPNAAYPVPDAIALCRRMEPLALEFYEDPADGLEGLAAVRARVGRPVATNMALIQPEHLAPAVRRGAVDVVLADIFLWGGIDGWCGIAAAAEAFGLEVAVHGFYETGIATACNLHLAAAHPNLRRASDCGLHQLAADVTVGPRPEIVAGRMALPAGPGLGVALDRDRIERYVLAEAKFGQID